MRQVLNCIRACESISTERPNQSLGYRIPDDVYATAVGGGARIVHKIVEMGQRHPAA
jgi:putative transposase